MTRAEILEVAKPILFSTEMVRAILDDRKSATRRVMKPQPCEGHGPVKFKQWFRRDWYTTFARFGDDESTALCDRKPHFQPGDLLWVRETWSKAWNVTAPCSGLEYVHKASCEKIAHVLVPEFGGHLKWRSSRYMPKAAARLFLRVTDVRVEQLQDITPEQCVAEGVEREALEAGGEFVRGIFSGIWDGPLTKEDFPLYSWDANPWVWVIEFERVTPDA